MAEPTLYLFDGFNLLHAGGFGSPEELRDLLASWVAAQGARGVLVFDGQGADERLGPLEVRWAEDADTLLERLAAEHRSREQVAVVSSDTEIRSAAGVEVRKLASQTFLGEFKGTFCIRQRKLSFTGGDMTTRQRSYGLTLVPFITVLI